MKLQINTTHEFLDFLYNWTQRFIIILFVFCTPNPVKGHTITDLDHIKRKGIIQ